MPVDYSKFKEIEDSDEEPIWEIEDGKKYKGLPQKALDTLNAAAAGLASRRCFCFLDFQTDPAKLKPFEQELAQSGAEVPTRALLGRVIIELDQAEHAPKLCENFRSLCTGERGTGVGRNKLHYKSRALDLVLPKFCLQASIRNELSCWGTYLPDEQLHIKGTSFDRPGLLAVGSHGPNTNSCTFMITLNEADHLDGYNQIIGRVVKGMEVLRAIEMLPTDRKERSFLEKNEKTWYGGKPVVDIVIEDCGELTAADVDLSAPADGDVFPKGWMDWSCTKDYSALFEAQVKIREIGNKHFKNKDYAMALEKYRKAQAYLQPLMKLQHHEEFPDEDVKTWMSGGLRPKERTEVVRADLTIKLNVCQVLLSMQEWHAAAQVADGVLLELVGKSSAKGNGALPNEGLVVKALFRRARARVGISSSGAEVSQLEEAIQDLNQALTVDPENGEVKKELDRVLKVQREADAPGKKVYESMLQPQVSDTARGEA